MDESLLSVCHSRADSDLKLKMVKRKAVKKVTNKSQASFIEEDSSIPSVIGISD